MTKRGDVSAYSGATIRELFAKAAMQGMLSCQDFINETARMCGSKEVARAQIAIWAVKQADALLVALDEATP